MKKLFLAALSVFFSVAVLAQVDNTIDKGAGWVYFSGEPGTVVQECCYAETAINVLTGEAWIWDRVNDEWVRWYNFTQLDTVPTADPGTGPFATLDTSTGQWWWWNDTDGEWVNGAAVMTGATGATDGASGLVPQPVAGDENKYLKGDGTWGTLSGDIPTTIGSLDDVSISAPVNGQTIVWQDSLWVNQALNVDDADADSTNEIQQIDTLSFDGTILSGSLSGDGVPADTADLSSLEESQAVIDTATAIRGDMVRRIGQLNDVDTSGVSTGKILKFNGVTWAIADDDGSMGSDSLGDLADVVLTGPTAGEILYFNGFNWIADSLDIEDGDADPTNEIQDFDVATFVDSTNRLRLSLEGEVTTYSIDLSGLNDSISLSDTAAVLRGLIPEDFGDLGDVTFTSPLDSALVFYDSLNGVWIDGPTIEELRESAGGGSPLTVAEGDSSPSVSDVTQINFDQADGFSVVDEGSGVVTINFSGAGTDNQTIDTLQLSGDTLQISLSGDNEPLQTVDLSSIGGGTDTSGYNLSINLAGTTLQLTDGDGTLTQDLASLQDGTGTDDQTFAEVLGQGNSAGASDIDMNDNSVNNMDSYSINTTSDDWLIFANGPNLQWSQTGAGSRLTLRGQTGTDLSRLGVGGLALPDWELDVNGVANADTFRVDGAYYFSTDPVVTSAGDTLIQVWTDSTTAFFIDKSEFGGTGSNQTLAQVLDEGNIANQNINLAQNSLMNVDTVRMDGSLGYFDISANGGPTLSARLSTSGDDFYRLKSNSDEVTFPLGNVGIGDFSSNTVGAGLHLYGTSVSTIRLSDSCSTDTCAQAYVDFYRGWNTSHLGRFGFDNSLTPDFYITNHLPGGKIHLETDGVTKFSLLPTGQIQLPQYGDTTFTGTAVKYLGVTDDGDVIEVDGGSGGANTFAVSSLTADGTDTIDFQTRTEGYFQIDMASVTNSTLVFDNPLSATAPTYRLHFQNAAAGIDTITFPDNVLFYNGDTLSSRRIDGDNLIECYYDATNFWCSDTLGPLITTPPVAPTYPPQTNLVAHWRSDTLISESGGKVYQWLDIQNNYALTIPSGADSVTYVTGSTPINNEPYLSFDGVNDGLSCTDTAVVNLVDTSRNFTMLIVTMPYDTTVNVNPITWSYTPNNDNSVVYQSNFTTNNESRFLHIAPTGGGSCPTTIISISNTQLQEWNYHTVLYDYSDIDFSDRWIGDFI
jgi:hypothetical protein